jgi:hypothetical protein
MQQTTYLAIPWALIFIIVKLGGTAFAAWSWLWVFLAIVPDLVVLLHHMHVL